MFLRWNLLHRTPPGWMSFRYNRRRFVLEKRTSSTSPLARTDRDSFPPAGPALRRGTCTKTAEQLLWGESSCRREPAAQQLRWWMDSQRAPREIRSHRTSGAHSKTEFNQNKTKQKAGINVLSSSTAWTFYLGTVTLGTVTSVHSSQAFSHCSSPRWISPGAG